MTARAAKTPKKNGKNVRFSSRSGTDYLLVRADGIGKVHVHAVIDTEDGERIAYLAEGINILDPETLTTEVKVTIAGYVA